MGHVELRLLLGVLSLLIAGCGTGSEIQSEPAESVTTVSTEPASTQPVEPDILDPNRFGDFPFEPSDRWLIGVDYAATSFVRLADDTDLDTEVTVHFSGRSQISVSAGGCSIGGGGFEWVDGRVTNPELGSDLMACTPSNPGAFAAANELIGTDPEIRVDDGRLLLLSDKFRLELEATGPGIIPLIEDNERFVAIETTVAGLEPARIELESPAHFVVKVIVPVCELYGAIAGEGEQTTLQMQPDLGHDQCEYAPASDKLAQAFFAQGATASRDGDTLEVSNEQGTIRFRIATDEDPPLTRETPDPPERIIPPKPDRTGPAEAGKLSVPWYATRAGSTGPGGADVPVPEDWDAANPAQPSIHVAGRGELHVYQVSLDQLPWTPESHSSDLEVVEGPTLLTIKLHQLQDGLVVESGATTTVRQYRYGSSDPNEWRRQVVWVLEREGETTIATVGFPEFPEGSDFAEPADTINLSLTGLDPIDLLSDIRFFE